MRWGVGRFILPHVWSSRVPVLVLIISSSLAEGTASFSSSSGVASSFPGVLSSHLIRLSCGGRRALPFILFQLSYELRKTAQDVIFRSSPSDTLGLLVPHSLRSSRLAVSWIVSCRIVVVVVARSGCRVLRFCLLARLVVAERPAFVLRRGGVLVLILRLSSRSLLVSPSRVASRLLVLPCPAGSGSVACLLVPSCLFSSWGALSVMVPGCLAVLPRLV